MFKKGKKTQVVKFDDDEGNEQTNEISQNLMNDISQMKIKESKKAENIKKIKNESNISFDEDISSDNFIQTKKSLIQKPRDPEPEEFNEIKKESTSLYTKDYLEELKAMTQKTNLNVMEKLTKVIDMDEIVEEDKNDEEKEHSETKELNIVDIEAEEEDQEKPANEDELQEIENAKKYREKKRKLNSGEYVSISKENAELEESAVNAEKLRIQNRILDQQNKAQPKNYDDEFDQEEQEELDKWQNKILKNTIDPKTRGEIDKFVRKEYNKDSSKLGALDSKAANKKVDIDFILKSLEENIKTEEAFYQNSIERVTKFMNLLSISNDVITTQQKTFTSGDNRIDLVQDISDYFSTLSDCLGEKNQEVDEAENMLDQVEVNYGKLLYEKIAFHICDELERVGSNPTNCKKINSSDHSVSNEEMNKRRKGEKLERHFEAVKELVFLNHREKLEFILSNTNSPFSFNDESKAVKDLKSDKTAIFNASQDIFSDVDEEYTNLTTLLDNFCKFSEVTQTSEEKIQEWFTECIAVFFRVDLVGFDPLGLTEENHSYHKKTSLLELRSLTELIPDIDTKILSSNKSELKLKLAQNFVSKYLEEGIFEKIKNIIANLWNPFSSQQTTQLARCLDVYIQTYYVNNHQKSVAHITKIKELLLKITDRLTQFIELLTFPYNCESSLGYYILNIGIQLYQNIFLFKKILPNTTIAQVAIDNLLSKKLLNPLNDFEPVLQIRLLAGLVRYIPEDILKTSSSKPEFIEIKNRIKGLADISPISSSNISEIDHEEIKKDSDFLKSI